MLGATDVFGLLSNKVWLRKVCHDPLWGQPFPWLGPPTSPYHTGFQHSTPF